MLFSYMPIMGVLYTERKIKNKIINQLIINNLNFLKKMKMNEIYEAPELEVLNVMIEKGFAASPSEEEDPNMPGINDPF